MADITKCGDDACPKRHTCWRWMAPAGEWQSYFAESPRKGDECDYYWPCKKDRTGYVYPVMGMGAKKVREWQR